MTIQNIEDVMNRIMSLNKNLTEESLQILLSASGWDKEDIQEGIKIFRDVKSGNYKTQSSNIENVFDNAGKENINRISVNPAYSNSSIQKSFSERDYSSNQKSDVYRDADIDTNTNTGGEEEDERGAQDFSKNLQNIFERKGFENQNANSINTNATFNNFQTQNSNTEKVNPFLQTSSDTDILHKKQSLIVTISIVAMTVIVISIFLYSKYFYQKSELATNNTNTSGAQNQNLQNTQDSLNRNIEFLQQQFAFSQKEVSDLKTKVSELTNIIEKTKTPSAPIIKYVSGRGLSGPAGSPGRGILSLDATSTGLFIHYTDKTKDHVGFPATTTLKNLNTENLCLKNAATSSICIDRNLLEKVLKSANLLN